MPKVSINILTRNRLDLLKKALESIKSQTFTDYEIVVIDDASTDNTSQYLDLLSQGAHFVVRQPSQKGIIFNRQVALENSRGEYVAILDDDDQWIDINKLKKQIDFLDEHKDYVLVGGGIKVDSGKNVQELKMRPETSEKIKSQMLFKNCFFTSTVMFRRDAAVTAGGFKKDGLDLAEDYDLWLRLGHLGKIHNFQEIFTQYTKPNYNKAKFKDFLKKQLYLIGREKSYYPGYFWASLILKLRILF